MITLPGATIVVLLIAQYTKAWIPTKVDTRLYVLLLSIAITQIALLMIGVPWRDHVLMVINAFVVAMAAIGGYQEDAFRFKSADENK